MINEAHNSEGGYTLVELSVVLLIMLAIAGIAVPYFGGASSSALCKATDVSMKNIKEAIMEGYYVDMLGKYPQDLQALVPNAAPDYDLHYLYSEKNITGDRSQKLYDTQSQTGWRQGGYLEGGNVLDATYLGQLKPGFSSNTYTHKAFVTGERIVKDSWGRPIILQVPSNCAFLAGTTDCARLVSAGAGSGLGTGDADLETPVNGHRPQDSDDRLLYLNTPTPLADVNAPCK
jgi:type II secretory pathway pseudopilin PulG